MYDNFSRFYPISCYKIVAGHFRFIAKRVRSITFDNKAVHKSLNCRIVKQMDFWFISVRLRFEHFTSTVSKQERNIFWPSWYWTNTSIRAISVRITSRSFRNFHNFHNLIASGVFNSPASEFTHIPQLIVKYAVKSYQICPRASVITWQLTDLIQKLDDRMVLQ